MLTKIILWSDYYIVISIGFEPISMPTSADAVIAPTFTDPPILLSP
jgi:hypothetical protein